MRENWQMARLSLFALLLTVEKRQPSEISEQVLPERIWSPF